MPKKRLARDDLNVALGKIAAANAMISALADALLPSEGKLELLDMAKQIDDGVSEAYAALRAIKAAVDVI